METERCNGRHDGGRQSGDTQMSRPLQAERRVENFA